jgi:Proteasome subunit
MGFACGQFGWYAAVVVAIGLVWPILASGRDTNFIHGTIVVVVQTKDGFVLAGDSRGTDGNCQALPNEYEKVFSIGKQSGIVVAGLIGSWAGDDLGVADSLAGGLHDEDQASNTAPRQPEATRAAYAFLFSLRRIIGLFDASSGPPPAAASAVSISDQGSLEWITLSLTPVRRRLNPSLEEWDYVVDHLVVNSPESKVIALGAGEPIVEDIINNGAASGAGSQDDSIKRYFMLRREHRLAELSLEDGERLARFLVNAAISFANAHPAQCFGIGGDIQMVAITKDGPRWALPLDKKKLARSWPPRYVRILNSPVTGRLDGGQWVRDTVPANGVVKFEGDADARVSQPKFDGKCTFMLGEKAEERMPEPSARLRSMFAPHCDVYRQTKSGPVKLSSAPPLPSESAPPIENNEDASLCNDTLRSKERELTTQLRAVATEHARAEQQIQFEEFQQELRASREKLPQEEIDVMRFKQRMLEDGRYIQFEDTYQRQFMPAAISIRHELIRRVSVPADLAHPDGRTPFLEWYELADELNALADLLPSGSCKAGQKIVEK